MSIFYLGIKKFDLIRILQKLILFLLISNKWIFWNNPKIFIFPLKFPTKCCWMAICVLQACVSLMRQLYARDLRRAFCPDGHWISQSVTMSLAMDRPSDATLRRRSRLRQHYRPFHSVLAFTQEELGKHHHELQFWPLHTLSRGVKIRVDAHWSPFVLSGSKSCIAQ